jgi:two-component system response regulator VanR
LNFRFSKIFSKTCNEKEFEEALFLCINALEKDETNIIKLDEELHILILLIKILVHK